MKLENNFVKIEVNELGGELTRIFLNDVNQELLVKENSWNRTAPWLFPVVGELSGGFFRHDGKVYKMKRHGFVRDKVWKLVKAKSFIKATYTHKADDEYPFDFKVEAKYTLLKDELKIEFDIKAKDEVRYNVGWHPALNYKKDLPIISTFEYQSSKNNIVGHTKSERNVLTFDEIKNDKTYIFDSYNFKLDYDGKQLMIHWCDFNFIGIWTKNKDEFISVEPWAKNLDLLNATPSLENKDLLCGNNKLTINIFFDDVYKRCFKNDSRII